MNGFTSADGSESFDIFGHLLTLLSGNVCDCFQRGWTSAVQRSRERERKKGSENRDFLFYYEIPTPETRTPKLVALLLTPCSDLADQRMFFTSVHVLFFVFLPMNADFIFTA